MGIRLVVVDDNPHLAWAGRVYPANATFHRFLSAFLDVPGGPIAEIVHCVPLRPAQAQPPTEPLDPRLKVVGTVPFDGITGFVRRAGPITRANRAILGSEIALADLLWLKVPASNAALAAALARRSGVPRFVWVAGRAVDVVRGQRRGLPAQLAALAAAAAYDVGGRVAGLGGETVIVGRGLLDGSGAVATLVEPDEIRPADDRASPFPRVPWRPRLGWAGRLAAGKGLEELLAAVAQLAALDGERRTIELVILGDGPLRAALVGLADELGIGERIHWLGLVADRRPYLEALAACDAFVFPSPAEGFPKVVLDAMAVGLPILASPAGALRELAKGGLLAALPAGDPAGIARAVDALLGDADRAARLRTAGAAFAARHTRPAEVSRLVERWRIVWPDLPWAREDDRR